MKTLLSLRLAVIFISTVATLVSALAQAPPDPCAPIFQRLKSFGFADKFGVQPVGNLVMDADGILYGATEGHVTAGTILVLTSPTSGGHLGG